MKFQASTMAALAVIVGAAAAARMVPHSYVLHEARAAPAESNWVKRSSMEGALTVPVRIGCDPIGF